VAVIFDLCSRFALGWAQSTPLGRPYPQTRHSARAAPTAAGPLLHHSDRGSREHRLPARASPARDHLQHGAPRRLLWQRGRRELLCNALVPMLRGPPRCLRNRAGPVRVYRELDTHLRPAYVRCGNRPLVLQLRRVHDAPHQQEFPGNMAWGARLSSRDAKSAPRCPGLRPVGIEVATSESANSLMRQGVRLIGTWSCICTTPWLLASTV
jgi:hypothetical protein